MGAYLNQVWLLLSLPPGLKGKRESRAGKTLIEEGGQVHSQRGVGGGGETT